MSAARQVDDGELRRAVPLVQVICARGRHYFRKVAGVWTCASPGCGERRP